MGVIDGAAGSGAFIQDAKSDAKSENHMSRVDAVAHLMRLMAGRRLSPEECEAVAMGVRCLVKRHRDRHMNYARRRAAQRQAPEESAGKENDEQS